MACVNKSAIIGHYFHFQIALHIPKKVFQSSFFSLHFEHTYNSEILLSKVICTQFYDCVNLNVSIAVKEREGRSLLKYFSHLQRWPRSVQASWVCSPIHSVNQCLWRVCTISGRIFQVCRCEVRWMREWHGPYLERAQGRCGVDKRLTDDSSEYWIRGTVSAGMPFRFSNESQLHSGHRKENCHHRLTQSWWVVKATVSYLKLSWYNWSS